jgi:uncharacterized protein YndB with AHSA1/START domain
MTRTVAHDTFVIERTLAASPARVYAAFADPEEKRRWFGDPDFEKEADHTVDFRVGGRESMSGRAPGGGPSFTYDALYQDIVADERIVYSYEMTMDGRRISVSVATLEFVPAPGGSRLILTEQGAYLDGLDTRAAREEGTRGLVENLARYVEGTAS